jgi:hypothetical protein
MLTLFAPLIILFTCIPGRNTFTWWLKRLFADLAIFPLVIAILILGKILVNLQISSGPLWSPPFLYGIDKKSISILMGMGLVLMIPQLIKAFKDIIGVKPSGISPGLSTFFGGSTAALQFAKTGYQSFGSLATAPFIGNRLPSWAARFLPATTLTSLANAGGHKSVQEYLDSLKKGGTPGSQQSNNNSGQTP